MTRFRVALVLFGLLMLCQPAFAAQRYAVIVSGASGGDDFAGKHERWRSTLVTSVRQRLRFPEANVFELSEAGAGTAKATRDNVRSAFANLKGRLTRADLLFVVLIGHGTFDGNQAKFNLVGPDLDAAEWTELFAPVPSQLVIVNTTGASFPFLQRLSAPRRVIITATDSNAQVYETVFAEYFTKAFDDTAADVDKNGRTSVWEAFTYASAEVKRYYEQKGQLSTERPLLDDNADGVGKEAAAPGPDGRMAGALYFDEETEEDSADPAVAALRQRRTALEAQIEELKQKKDSLPADAYMQQLEKLLLELAQVSQQIRAKSP